MIVDKTPQTNEEVKDDPARYGTPRDIEACPHCSGWWYKGEFPKHWPGCPEEGKFKGP